MTDQTDALQTILTDVDQLLREKFREIGFPDTPFVLAAISPGNQLVLRGNLTPDGLKHMAEDLSEAADEAQQWPANDDSLH